jgi:outer membrane receptor protein involved in Fe transport
MEWTDIQLSGDPSEEDPWWVRGYFNGEKAEQKGVELNTEWQATDRLWFQVGGFIADPEFSETTTEPDGDIIEAGWPMPDSPEHKFWTAAEYRVPGFLIRDGEFWTRLTYSHQGEYWNTLTSIADNNRDQIVPSSSTATLQFGVSSNNGWDAALIVRNLFDDDSPGWMSTTNYGASFGDSRFRYRPSPQRPRSISLSFTKRW